MILFQILGPNLFNLMMYSSTSILAQHLLQKMEQGSVKQKHNFLFFEISLSNFQEGHGIITPIRL